MAGCREFPLKIWKSGVRILRGTLHLCFKYYSDARILFVSPAHYPRGPRLESWITPH
jgi:hypothetical protein